MNNKDLHYKYIIFILIAGIILLVALDYYKVQELVDKLSFALTLSSLLLAIIAIFYTIISASKQDHQFVKLIETNATVSNSAKEISLVSNSLEKMLKEIPSEFEGLNTKIDTLSAEERFASSSANRKDIQRELIKDHSLFLKCMVGNLQYNAICVIYLYVKAALKGKDIPFDYFVDVGLKSPEYGIGVLTGFGSTGLLEFKVKKVLEVIEEDQKERISNIVEKIKNKYS